MWQLVARLTDALWVRAPEHHHAPTQHFRARAKVSLMWALVTPCSVAAPLAQADNNAGGMAMGSILDFQWGFFERASRAM